MWKQFMSLFFVCDRMIWQKRYACWSDAVPIYLHMGTLSSKFFFIPSTAIGLNTFCKRESFWFSPFLSSATYWRVELFDLEEVMANEGSKGIQGSSQIFVSLTSPICLLMPSVRTTPTANKLQHPHEARDPNFAWKKNPLLENMAISHWNCFCKIGTRV